MQNLPINVVDLSVLGILLLSAIFAFARGFVREVLSVIGWVGAGLVSLHGAPELLPYTHRYVSSGFLADAGTYVAVFILALLLFSILSHMISVRVRDSALGAVDRSLGFVYGLGLARTLCFICFAWYAWAEPDLPWFLIGITLFNTVIRYMEIVGLYSVFMGAATRAQAGTDFTLLSSAQLVVFMLGSMASGFIADWIGYDGLFALAVILSGIGIVLSMRVLPRHNQAWSGR